jgi:hypothetical protein
MDVAATTIGQGIGGIGAQMFIHSNPVALSTAVASGDYSGDYAVGVVTGQGKGGGSAAVDAAVLAELNLKK